MIDATNMALPSYGHRFGHYKFCQYGRLTSLLQRCPIRYLYRKINFEFDQSLTIFGVKLGMQSVCLITKKLPEQSSINHLDVVA